MVVYKDHRVVNPFIYLLIMQVRTYSTTTVISKKKERERKKNQYK